MQAMQRQFGRMLHKSPGDNAKVAVLLSDYEDVDRVLAKIIDAAKSWRDSWINLSSTQLGVVTEYDGLWDPIVGASEGLGKAAAPTPQLQLEQALRLKEVYAELKADLLEEMELIEAQVVKPAGHARESISPIRKTIKKRENKRLDYEKLQEKTTKLQRKLGRTAKEDASLAKLQAELARVSDDFHAADAHLRETLPPIVAAAFSLIPLLINSVITLQNRFLGLYYTTLHNYCEAHGFPSPPPPMDEVIVVWSAGYEPVKKEFESITCIATGKAVRLPMKLPDDPSFTDRVHQSTPTLISGRSSASLVSTNENDSPQSSKRTLSTTSSPQQPYPLPAPHPFTENHYVVTNNNLTPTDFTTASRLGQQLTPAVSPTSVQPRSDYLSNRPPSTSSTVTSTASFKTATSSGSFGAARKKPPPPPPKKFASQSLGEFVVALYTFDGGAGDLSFREGDRIKIVKKTDTLDDWWVGELDGVKGSFPANYCRAG